jgi:hypothetical protein
MTLDGLGRVVATQTSLNEKQSREFDEQGQLVFESYPYAMGTPEVGDKYQYDALGRRTITWRRYRATGHLPLAGSCTELSSCKFAIAYDDRLPVHPVTGCELDTRFPAAGLRPYV